ncbi:gamma-glutamyltransferase [Robiginitomaculum antarcticum]|uniref:gamma-glutamyltransferase n=1 Tax=Robiginitomaculum antarcticum TaxID=437507 RepID=UPI000364E7CD|nr:gamma-glutamyltransferase [Robiginitomaculum antarcticum]
MTLKSALLSVSLTALFSMGLTACAPAPHDVDTTAPKESRVVNPDSVMVAAADPRAVSAGLRVLEEGGTAVDAAIAVQSVLGLVEPQSSGIGGGAFLMFYNAADKSVTMYDGRETAPMAADEGLFLDADGNRLPYVQGIASGKSTGVPGAVAMLAMAHDDHGRLPWARAFKDAITLADEGFIVSPRMAGSLARSTRYGLLNDQKAARDYFYPGDGETPLQDGERRTNAPYAATLRAISADYRALYEGDIARAIIAATRDEPRPGGLTEADFAAYTPVRRAALCSDYRAYRICGAQPPSSGGVATQAVMGLLSNFDMRESRDDVQGWHRFIEASRLAYADRDHYVGDDRFVQVPIAGMLNTNYLALRAAKIQDDAVMAKVEAGRPPGAEQAGKDATPDSPGTSHFSILDSYGNVVSMTTTVEGGFGSQRMAAGMILNNQLTDFSFVSVDEQGRKVANRVQPGKRPRSSMAPTIILNKDGGDFYIATGSPGGNSIIAYTAKTMVALLDWDMTPQEAANLPNVIARGESVRIEENRMDEATLSALEIMGHDIQRSQGEASGIHIIRKNADGTLQGGADPRREGVAWTLSDLDAQTDLNPK